MALIAATAAATVASAMYLDAKHAIRKDLCAIQTFRQGVKGYTEAAKKRRQSLYYLFEESVQKAPNNEAIWSREGCYTWAQTYHLAHQYAEFYQSQGVKPGDLVAFYLTNSPDFIFAWLGLWAIGASPAMINYNLAGKALVHCLTVGKAKLVLVDEDATLRSRIEEIQSQIEGDMGARICILDAGLKKEIYSLKGERPADTFRERVTGKSPMCLFYTSGTTGMPKAVPYYSDRAYLTALGRRAPTSPVKDTDRWYDCMPYYHGTGGAIAMLQMTVGTTLCIGKKFSTSRFWGEVHDSRANWITYVGETARYLLAAPPSPLDKDHEVRGMYGNGLRPDVWFKFRERFNVPEVIEFFNSSEGIFALATYARGDYFAACVGHQGLISQFIYRNILVPVSIDSVSGAIVRDPKTGFAIREPYEKGGEMIVAIPDESMFAGYFGNPEATAKKFARDVFKKGDLWYRSGDALRRDAEGKWHFLDRLGDTFRWKGENVSTAEVAEVVGKYPGVVEANVYGVALPTHDGRAGCAAVYIDPKHQKDFDYAGLLRHSRTHLPKYAVPVFLRIVKEMTPIHNNKQNKVPLREEGVDPDKVQGQEQILWIDQLGKGHNYVEFQRDHWESLKLAKASL